ncbi:hypothetical protein [Sphingorhabdus lutea]|uniref:hypothetical protein n=1 Tax=Sphingorhabdus lutea TaxID=1913578 RepID=UPI0012ECB4DC|nr:hypothetical protein [Sphingorhabdus lutea]
MSSWILAEYFTRKKLMALPSIILSISFVGSIAAFGFHITGLGFTFTDLFDPNFNKLLVVAGFFGSLAAWGHWKRFNVPISLALLAASLTLAITALISSIFSTIVYEHIKTFLALAGIIIFIIAMRWDIADRKRLTIKSDVAFWLHLLAAPLLTQPLFILAGLLNSQGADLLPILTIFITYFIFAIISLMIDRRALLLSALSCVLIALYYLFDSFGMVELNVALTALIIGSALLTLSVFWTKLRANIVNLLPAKFQEYLPPLTE